MYTVTAFKMRTGKWDRLAIGLVLGACIGFATGVLFMAVVMR